MLPKSGILIKNHQHQKNFKTKFHAHKIPSLVYTISGKGICHLKNTAFPLKADTLALVPARMPHQLIDEPGHPMTVFVIYFHESVCLEYMPLWTKITREIQTVEFSPYVARDFRRWLREMLFEQNHKYPFYKSALKILFSAMLLRIIRHITRQNPKATNLLGKTSSARVRDVLSYLAGSYYKPQSLAEAAKSASLSQRRFSSIVRKLTGMSFVEYVQDIRVQKAVKLLKSTTMPITAIAFEVGFEDLSTFYRSFQKRKKVPPAKFRNPPGSLKKSSGH